MTRTSDFEIRREKLVEYLLKPDHKDGRSKAKLLLPTVSVQLIRSPGRSVVRVRERQLAGPHKSRPLRHKARQRRPNEDAEWLDIYHADNMAGRHGFEFGPLQHCLLRCWPDAFQGLVR